MPTDKSYCLNRRGLQEAGVSAINQLLFPCVILLAPEGVGREFSPFYILDIEGP